MNHPADNYPDKAHHPGRKVPREMISWQSQETPGNKYNQVYPDIEPEFGIRGAVLGKGNMTTDGGALLRLPTNKDLKHARLMTNDEVELDKARRKNNPSPFNGVDD